MGGQHLMDNLSEPEFARIDYFEGDDDESEVEKENDGECNDEWKSTAHFERDQRRFYEEREERVNWDLAQMKAYFDFIGTFKAKKVVMGDAADKILTEYFKVQRSSRHRDKSRTTIRLLESLVRLAQAHALLMYRSVVLSLDAIETVHLMNTSVISTNEISDFCILQTVFPRDGQSEYETKRAQILKMLFPREWAADECASLNDDDWDYGERIKERELEEIAAFDESVFGEFETD